MKINIRMIVFLTVFGLLCVFSATCIGQVEKAPKQSIDATLAACLKIQHGTNPRAKCYSDAFDAWEKDVAAKYAELMKTISADDKVSLAASQTAWEKYRDSEFDLITQFYGKRKGTLYISARIIMRIEIVKARAVRLDNWLEAVKK